jgi:hypothetical protein
VVKVPDVRLGELARLLRPKRVVPAEVEFVDFPGSLKGYTREKGSGAGFLPDLAQMDGLIQVVRAFPQEAVPHEEGSVDPWRDMDTLAFELAFADLVVMERRLERIRESVGKVKPQEREALEKERALLSRLREGLEGGLPLRAQQVSEQEGRLLRNFQFLTASPLLTVLNIAEDEIPQASALEEEGQRRLGQGTAVAALCCEIEMEMAQLEPEDAQEFRASLGIAEPLTDRLLSLCHLIANRIHFFTIAHDETKAWSLPRGSTALQAAGLIHSDMERGFIRAEVIPWQELLRSGSLAEARRQGLLRSEGKGYQVQDGDVITFLFNV